MTLRDYGPDEVMALGWRGAVEALRATLVAGVDPEAQPPRSSAPLGGGELLTMPATIGSRAGVKLAAIVPDNPSRGLPRIHAVYVLFDAASLAPIATVDGVALTTLRTPAVSALGVDLVAPAEAARLVVFGIGPQAAGHVHALRAVRPVTSVAVVGRDAARTARFVAELAADSASDGLRIEAADASSVRDADLIACCTTAREPLFDGRELPDHAVVVACGSHEPDAREVDTETVRRAGGAVVEAVSVARREAGDVIMAGDPPLVTLAELARGEATHRPRFVKTVGMAWEDLCVAAAVAGDE